MNLHRDILRLAVPSILANITVPLVGMVDIAVAGHLGAAGGLGAAALIGGITIGTMLFDMLYWNFGFLRAGTGGLTAQAYGRHRTGVEEAAGDIAVTLKRALAIALGSGLVMVALLMLRKIASCNSWVTSPTACSRSRNWKTSCRSIT